MHRHSVSCILGVFANCAFNVPWAIFDAQAQCLVHSGLLTISIHSPTAGRFLCTGFAFRAFFVFLLTVHLTCPWAICDAQAQYLVHSGLPTIIQPFSDRGPLCMHRRCVSCIFGAFVNCAINVPWAIVDAQAQDFVHSGPSTWTLGCQPYPTILSPRAVFYAPAWRFVHLCCFCQLCNYRALGYF